MSNLTHEEKLVYDVIVSANPKVTQLFIARKVYVGCHDRFEGYDTPKQSTLRKVRQIIRDLRMNHSLFILSDEEGYWVMKDKSEAKTYIERMERIAKATTKGYFDTFRAMQKAFGVTSEYFRKQGELFD